MICIPIIGNTHEDALRQIEMSLHRADVLELRMDLIRDGDLRALIEKCRIGPRSIKVLVTHRRKGSSEEGEISEEEQRIALLKEAVCLGAEYVDVEVDTPEAARKELLALVRDTGYKTRLIASHHDFHRTPSLASLKDIVHKCIETGASIVKIVTYAENHADNLTVLRLIPYVQKKKKEIIAFCMGEKGRLSRITAPLLGSYLSYVSLSRGAESAPGQLTVDEMEQIMVCMDGIEAGKDTSIRPPDVQIFGIFGNPIKQSLSPLMHEAALAQMKINAKYLPFCVHELTSAIRGIRGMGIRGVSVTIPFKVMAMAHLDEVDADAREIGAVNTIVNHHGILKGFNTDWIGLVHTLKNVMDIRGKVFAVIGAGGAARAAVFGIRKEGGVPVIVNRNVERGQYLAQELECSFYPLKEITDVRADCLVNTTPVGMVPDIHETPIESSILAHYRWVMDMIYNPLKTKLLKDAENAGCITIPGVEMFVHQGAEQIKIWTGMEPPREFMKQVVMERLLYAD